MYVYPKLSFQFCYSLYDKLFGACANSLLLPLVPNDLMDSQTQKFTIAFKNAIKTSNFSAKLSLLEYKSVGNTRLIVELKLSKTTATH